MMNAKSTGFVRLRAQGLSVLRRMDWLRGLRAAVALCVPLILGSLLNVPNLGWAGLGGYEAIVADPGGPYRQRMRSLLTLAIGGGLGVFLGSIAGDDLYIALPLTIAWCFVWSYLAVLGQPFTTAGVLVQVVYVCGLGAPARNWHEALPFGLLLMAGGLWALLLSLFLWPLDRYRPARGAVADCYTALASLLDSILELSERAPQRVSLWHRLARHHQYRIRRALERGWEAVAHVERVAGAMQEQQLVVLLETADMLLARTIAMAEYLEAQWAEAAGQSGCERRGVTGLAELRDAERWVASFLVRRGSETAASVNVKREAIRTLPQSLEGCLEQSDPALKFLLAQVAQAASLLETAMESTALLRFGTATSGQKPPRGPAASASHFGYVYERMGRLRQGWDFDLLAANLTRGSLTLRHAGRVSIVCGLDVAIMILGHIDHGYWLLLTSLIVLQPHVAGTLRRGMERIGGTVAGGILAALLAMNLHTQAATAAVLFPLAWLTLATLPVSYAAFAFFLTPTFVLAWMPFAGDWQLALIRMANTVGGALLSVLAMLFLFPAYERERAPQFLREAVAADRRYLAALAEAWRTASRSSRILANARRATGLVHNDAEESLERLLAESWQRRVNFAQFAAAFVTYLRRFGQSVTTLAALEGDREWKQSPVVQERLALLDRRMAWIEAKLAGGSSEDPWPGELVLSAEPPRQTHPGDRQLERLERQTGVLFRQLAALQEHGLLGKTALSGE